MSSVRAVAPASPIVLVAPGLLVVSLLLAATALRHRGTPAIRALLRGPNADRSSVDVEKVGILERLGRSSLGQRMGTTEALRRRSRLAGSPVSLEALRGIKVAIIGGLTGGALWLSFVGWSAALLVMATVPLVVRVPDVLLARQATRRQAKIGDRVPELVEILVATGEAGLSPPLAFRRAAALVTGPLGEELNEAVLHLDLGLPWRRALDHLIQNTDVPTLRRLVAALGRSYRLGTPMRAVLRSVADDLRLERRARAEEMARRAPVKMLFPMVFLILPAFLLLTVGPVLLATIRALR